MIDWLSHVELCDVCHKPLVRCANCGAVGGGPCECGTDGQLLEADATEQSRLTRYASFNGPEEYDERAVHSCCEDKPSMTRSRR
jgi:hypothetical protein